MFSRRPLPASGLSLSFASLRISTPRTCLAATTTTGCSSPAPGGVLQRQPFSSTPPSCARAKRKPYDPFAAERARQRKLANQQRQKELTAQRAANAADPVLGHATAFQRALDEVPPVRTRTGAVPRLNHLLEASELPGLLERSRKLAYARLGAGESDDPFLDQDEERQRALDARHAHAVEAIRRIVSLGTGSSADRTRANKQLVIDTFGRHATDGVLPRDPGAPTPAETGKTPRAGPDTGSSEVQAAILTVKIRALAKALEEGRGKDKHNKRNLRLMVHRRQKLLKYLKRKEKGGIRYRNVMQALGLDDAAIEKELFL